MDLTEFQKVSGIIYPPFSLCPFEKYFHDFIMNQNNKDVERKYIPIYWTELQISSYDRNKLQCIMDNWDKENTYFTIVQHDDGINISIPQNIKVFGMGGVGHIPLPLTYDNKDLFEKYKYNSKNIFCSFVGSITHLCRQRMVDTLNKYTDVMISTDNWTNDINTSKQEHFLNITSNSRFTLCPRGYGKTSFRLYEAFKLKSIPVYIYDDCFLPYKEILDWTKMCVVIHISEIEQLYLILKSITDEQINDMFKYYAEHEYLFTYDGMCDYVVNNLNK